MNIKHKSFIIAAFCIALLTACGSSEQTENHNSQPEPTEEVITEVVTEELEEEEFVLPENISYIKSMYVSTEYANDMKVYDDMDNYETVCYVPFGESVEIWYEYSDKYDCDYSYICYDGKWGWCYSYVLSDSSVQTNEEQVTQPENYYQYKNDNDMFTVRAEKLEMHSAPDEKSEVVKVLNYGDYLRKCGDNSGQTDWIYTYYEGVFGWIKTCSSETNEEYVSFYFEVLKPVIYLYPEKETDIEVKVDIKNGYLWTTYPKYNDGWKVTAYPDGRIVNKADGKNYEYLFWDAKDSTQYDMSSGFCIKGKDTEEFLREKLEYLGLNETEMNEFIVYWLPLMEHNEYNLISFQSDLYKNNCILDVTPEPDSVLRVFMTFKALDEEVFVRPQKLESFERNGFTVVEWGGQCRTK